MMFPGSWGVFLQGVGFPTRDGTHGRSQQKHGFQGRCFCHRDGQRCPADLGHSMSMWILSSCDPTRILSALSWQFGSVL